MKQTRSSQPARRRPPRPSFNLDVMAWARTVSQPKGLARALLFELARCADEYGCSWYRQRCIAQNIGCTSRTIRTHLRTLQELGLVRRIGRVGEHGGQVSSVVQLIGWPDRRPIPRSGHPRLGSKVREDKYAALERSRTMVNMEQKQPQGAETFAEQNNTVEINTTTEVGLKTCLDALGAWATDNNRKKLVRSGETLEALLKDGFGLEAEILPLLRTKASSRAVVPDLTSWNYFRSALEARRARPARQRATKKPALQPHVPRPSEPEPHPPLAADAESPTQPSRATELAGDSESAYRGDVAALLRRSAKTYALKSGAEWL